MPGFHPRNTGLIFPGRVLGSAPKLGCTVNPAGEHFKSTGAGALPRTIKPEFGGQDLGLSNSWHSQMIPASARAEKCRYNAVFWLQPIRSSWPKDLIRGQGFWVIGLGWAPNICTANVFPGEAADADLGISLWKNIAIKVWNIFSYWLHSIWRHSFLECHSATLQSLHKGKEIITLTNNDNS